MSLEHKGFFASLFDMNFEEFITERIIKLLYVLAILGAAGFGLIPAIAGFQLNFLAGLFGLALWPLIFLLYVVMARVGLETVMVLFRIAHNTGDTERILEKDYNKAAAAEAKAAKATGLDDRM